MVPWPGVGIPFVQKWLITGLLNDPADEGPLFSQLPHRGTHEDPIGSIVRCHRSFSFLRFLYETLASFE